MYPAGAALPDLPDDEPVYVSDPVRVVREYRCFLQHGVCRTGSLYAVDGRPAPLPAADAAFAAADAPFAAAARVAEQAVRVGPPLPAAVVVDVGVLADGRLAVVEANSLAESALYGADTDVVLELLGTLFGHDLGV